MIISNREASQLHGFHCGHRMCRGVVVLSISICANKFLLCCLLSLHRTLANYIVWQLVKKIVPRVSPDDDSENKPLFCASELDVSFGFLTSSLFVRGNFTEKDRSDVGQ